MRCLGDSGPTVWREPRPGFERFAARFARRPREAVGVCEREEPGPTRCQREQRGGGGHDALELS
jgi:hypothetical protein